MLALLVTLAVDDRLKLLVTVDDAVRILCAETTTNGPQISLLGSAQVKALSHTGSSPA